jgi:hypothetical protein
VDRVNIQTSKTFILEYPNSLQQAILYLTNVQKSLAHVPFIQGLRLIGNQVYADLVVDVPVLGQQRLDFHSVLEPHKSGANLIAQPLQGKAWAEVSGLGSAVQTNQEVEIHYALSIIVHLELPNADKWGGRAFEKMAQATARTAIERMTREFGHGVQMGMGR